MTSCSSSFQPGSNSRRNRADRAPYAKLTRVIAKVPYTDVSGMAMAAKATFSLFKAPPSSDIRSLIKRDMRRASPPRRHSTSTTRVTSSTPTVPWCTCSTAYKGSQRDLIRQRSGRTNHHRAVSNSALGVVVVRSLCIRHPQRRARSLCTNLDPSLMAQFGGKRY